MKNLWEQAEPVLRHRAYDTLDNDPRILLEGDGGPSGIEAEVYLARLFGFDDQIVEDGLRLSEPLPMIRMPLPSRVSLSSSELFEPMRTVEYVMQSGFAVVTLAAEYAPPNVKLRPDFTFRVLYLRYRRRS